MTFNKTKNKYMNMKSMIVCLVTLSACGTSPEQTSVPASLPTTESSLPVVEEEKPAVEEEKKDEEMKEKVEEEVKED